MPVVINDTISVHAPKPNDFRFMDFQGGISLPFTSSSAAISAVPQAYRYQYLTLWALAANGDPLEYWWRADTTDGSLEPKSKESYTLNTSGSITFNPPYRLEGVVVIPTSSLATLTIGLTNGGGELEPGAAVANGAAYNLSLGQFVNTPLTLYFGGLASGTKIIFYKKP